MSAPKAKRGDVSHDKNEKAALCVRFDYERDLLDRVKVHAKANHVSVSVFVRSVLRDYFKK